MSKNVCQGTLFLLGFLVFLAQAQAQQQSTFELCGMVPYSVPLLLVIRQSGAPNIDITARYFSEPFVTPFCWVWRIGRWVDQCSRSTGGRLVSSQRFYRATLCAMPGGGKNLSMDTMIAYCGLACDTCPIHLATLEQDFSKRQMMRASIAHVCREQYGMNLQLQDITDCDGCRSETGRLFSGCARCEIRMCAINRKLTSCAFCADYACEKLLKHFEDDPSSQAGLEKLRSVS